MHILFLFKSSVSRDSIIFVDVFGDLRNLVTLSVEEFDQNGSQIIALIKKKNNDHLFFYRCIFNFKDFLKVQGSSEVFRVKFEKTQLGRLKRDLNTLAPAQLKKINANPENKQINMPDAQTSSDSDDKVMSVNKEDWWSITILNLLCIGWGDWRSVSYIMPYLSHFSASASVQLMIDLLFFKFWTNAECQTRYVHLGLILPRLLDSIYRPLPP